MWKRRADRQTPPTLETLVGQNGNWKEHRCWGLALGVALAGQFRVVSSMLELEAPTSRSTSVGALISCCMGTQALERPRSALEISVVVPTRNRPVSLRRTVEGFRRQDLEVSAYEIVVVDDGSEPPVTAVESDVPPAIRVVRLEHGERSAARNAGAAHATGRILVFVDDDMLPDRRLLRAHLSAQDAWPGALATGAIRLPERVLRTPFGRFRGELEGGARSLQRGPVEQANFAAAGNLSLPRERFLALGGFDRRMASSEDQDLALRHSAQGGKLVFLPDAVAVHDDSAVEPLSYWARSEWGAEHMAPFCALYPDWPDNRQSPRGQRSNPLGRGFTTTCPHKGRQAGPRPSRAAGGALPRDGPSRSALAVEPTPSRPLPPSPGHSPPARLQEGLGDLPSERSQRNDSVTRTVLHFAQDSDTSGFFPQLAVWHDPRRFQMLFGTLGPLDPGLRAHMERHGVSCLDCACPRPMGLPAGAAAADRIPEAAPNRHPPHALVRPLGRRPHAEDSSRARPRGS